MFLFWTDAALYSDLRLLCLHLGKQVDTLFSELLKRDNFFTCQEFQMNGNAAFFRADDKLHCNKLIRS